MKKSKNQKSENWNPGSNFDFKQRNDSNNMNQERNERPYGLAQNRNDQKRSESDYSSGSGFTRGQSYREQDNGSRTFDNQNEYSDNDNWTSESNQFYGGNTRGEQNYSNRYPSEDSRERSQWESRRYNGDEENRDQRNRQNFFQPSQQNQYGRRDQDERDTEYHRYQQSLRNSNRGQNFDNRQGFSRSGQFNEDHMGQSDQRRGSGNYSSGEYQGNYGGFQGNNGHYQERRNDSNRFEQQRGGPNAGQYREHQGDGEGYSTMNSSNRRESSNKAGRAQSSGRYNTSTESNNYDSRSNYDHSDTDEDFEEEPISASTNENKTSGGNKKGNKSGKQEKQNISTKGGKKSG